MNSLDQILTSVVNFAHLTDFAGTMPVYTRKQIGSFSSFILYHNHVYFILLQVFIWNWCSFLEEIFCLPIFPSVMLLTFCEHFCRVEMWFATRFSMCCRPLLLPPPPLCGADGSNSHGGSWCSWGVSSLMPLLYDGNSLWSFWRRECTVDYCLLFMTFKILLGLCFFLLSSSNPLTTCPEVFGLKLPATWGILLFIMVVTSIILHSYWYLPTTCLPL